MNAVVYAKGSANALDVENGPAVDNVNGDVAHHDPNHDVMKRLYVFSAKSESSLLAYLSSFLEYLNTVLNSSTFMKDLCFTLGQRRTHHAHRIAVAADSLESLKAELSMAKSKKIKERIITFVFTGQGAQ